MGSQVGQDTPRAYIPTFYDGRSDFGRYTLPQ